MNNNLLPRHVKEQLGDELDVLVAEVVDTRTANILSLLGCPSSTVTCSCLFSSCKTVNAGVVAAAAAATFTSEPGQPLHNCTTNVGSLDELTFTYTIQ